MTPISKHLAKAVLTSLWVGVRGRRQDKRQAVEESQRLILTNY